MGLQKFRADESRQEKGGVVAWYARWMGGITLAKLENCPTPYGNRTVYITGEPDTFYSLPATCRAQGKTVKGYVMIEDGQWEFRAYKGD